VIINKGYKGGDVTRGFRVLNKEREQQTTRRDPIEKSKGTEKTGIGITEKTINRYRLNHPSSSAEVKERVELHLYSVGLRGPF
jgi:hypothetical protein